MKRREFITLLGGAVTWPLAARAQQPERMRRIGVLMAIRADDPEGNPRRRVSQGLQNRVGPTAAMSGSITAGAAAMPTIRKYAAELVRSRPTSSWPWQRGRPPLLQATRTIPIVFTSLRPSWRGLVDSLGAAGRQCHRFPRLEYSIGGKWLELLKEIAPQLTRWRSFAIWHSRRTSACSPYPAAAPSLGVEVRPSICRCWRDRARHHGVRAGREWRPDRRPGAPGAISSRSDLALAAQQRFRRLLRPLFCHRRRADLLWAGSYRSVPASPLVMSIASSGARNRPICRCRHRPSTSWSSTSRPRRRSASKYRRRCSPAPTR